MNTDYTLWTLLVLLLGWVLGVGTGLFLIC